MFDAKRLSTAVVLVTLMLSMDSAAAVEAPAAPDAVTHEEHVLRAHNVFYNLFATNALQAGRVNASGSVSAESVYVSGNEVINGNLAVNGQLTLNDSTIALTSGNFLDYAYFATPNGASAAADTTAVKFGETPDNVSNYATSGYSIGGTSGDTITILVPGTYLVNCILVGSSAGTSTAFRFGLTNNGTTTYSYFGSGIQTANEVTQFTGSQIFTTTASNATLKVFNACGAVFTYSASDGSSNGITRAITLLRLR